MEFIHRSRAQGFRGAEVNQLRAPRIESVKAGDVRASLRHRVGIILRPVVEKVVGGKKSPGGVGVKPLRAFVVPQGLIVSGGREGSVRIVGGLGPILQKIAGRPGPCALRDRGAGENAVCGGASRCGVRLARRYRITQFLRKQPGPIRTANGRG